MARVLYRVRSAAMSGLMRRAASSYERKPGVLTLVPPAGQPVFEEDVEESELVRRTFWWWLRRGDFVTPQTSRPVRVERSWHFPTVFTMHIGDAQYHFYYVRVTSFLGQSRSRVLYPTVDEIMQFRSEEDAAWMRDYVVMRKVLDLYAMMGVPTIPQMQFALPEHRMLRMATPFFGLRSTRGHISWVLNVEGKRVVRSRDHEGRKLLCPLSAAIDRERFMDETLAEGRALSRRSLRNSGQCVDLDAAFCAGDHRAYYATLQARAAASLERQHAADAARDREADAEMWAHACEMIGRPVERVPWLRHSLVSTRTQEGMDRMAEMSAKTWGRAAKPARAGSERA